MSKEAIKAIIEERLMENHKLDFGVKGVQLFKVTEILHCAPVVNAPTVVAILSGSKEVIHNRRPYEYDSEHYFCCSMSTRVKAGTSKASRSNPLLGVIITLDTRLMTEIAIKMENTAGVSRLPKGGRVPQGLILYRWDDGFTEALLRLVQLSKDPEQAAVLGECRLRELYYAILKGETGAPVRQIFGLFSTSQFSRAFKGIYGLSPKQWLGLIQPQAEAKRGATHFFNSLQHMG